jgi:hypothetical protein
MKYEYHVEPFSSNNLHDLISQINEYIDRNKAYGDNGLITKDVRISYSSAYNITDSEMIYSAIVMFVDEII